MNPILHHVTLQTGHDRESPRSEVSDDVIATLAPLLRQALRGHEPEVPWVRPIHTMTGAAAGDVALITIWAPPLGEQRVPIATIGLARGPGQAERLWAMLHSTYVGMMSGDDAELATPADQPPPWPWCAARLEAGLMYAPESATLLGDLERCLAWTWIERGAPRPGRLRAPAPSARPARQRGQHDTVRRLRRRR